VGCITDPVSFEPDIASVQLDGIVEDPADAAGCGWFDVHNVLPEPVVFGWRRAKINMDLRRERIASARMTGYTLSVQGAPLQRVPR